jgi:hypothetical protein
MPRRSASLPQAKKPARKPLPKRRADPTPSQQEKKYALIAAYAGCGRITEACQVVGINRTTHYEWKKTDEAYAKAFEDSHDQVADLLEAEAVRRGRLGVEEPVFYKGEICGSIQKFSDLLLIFMLKALRPGKYRDNVHHEHEGKVTLEQLVAGSRLPEHDHA